MTTEDISKILLNSESNVPFIYFDLKNLVLSLQRLFIKLEIIDQCQTASDGWDKSPRELEKIDAVEMGLLSEI